MIPKRVQHGGAQVLLAGHPEAVSADFHFGPHSLQILGHGRDAIGFLYAQFRCISDGQSLLALRAENGQRGNFVAGKFEQKPVFFEDLCTTPASRPVEFCHDMPAVFEPQIEHAVFHAVQLRNMPAGLEPEFDYRIDDFIGGKTVEVV